MRQQLIKVINKDGSTHFERTRYLTLVYITPDHYVFKESIAYGAFKGDNEIFIIHTYLSVLSKLLAYEVLTRDDFIDDKELKGAIDGSIFKNLNVDNFVENDFYHWVEKDEHFHNIKKIFRKIAYQLGEYDFSHIGEDILKGVYQELIDIDTRHSLGEYYTPDWLCETMVNRFQFHDNTTIIDPACGSGSFLRVVIKKFNELPSNLSAREITNQIVGIDIHPLSIQIAKTTVLLALSEKIKKLKKPISLRIYLANTLLRQNINIGIFGNKFRVVINYKQCELSKELFEDSSFYDNAISLCEFIASSNPNLLTEEDFRTILVNICSHLGLCANKISSFLKIYKNAAVP